MTKLAAASAWVKDHGLVLFLGALLVAELVAWSFGTDALFALNLLLAFVWYARSKRRKR